MIYIYISMFTTCNYNPYVSICFAMYTSHQLPSTQNSFRKERENFGFRKLNAAMSNECNFYIQIVGNLSFAGLSKCNELF